MKMLLRVIGLILIFHISQIVLPAKSSAQNVIVSYQVFYDELSPYGYWVDYPSYGYVWVPNVGPGFYPYSTGGHWVYTTYGWTWVSDYAWGWAPFHYGRWDYDSYYGWLWLPSYEWGPAWVSWRHSNGYYGWAPLGPNITVVQSHRGYEIPADRWRFVRERDINRTNIHKYYVNRSRNQTYLKNSTIINNTYVDQSRGTTYAYGPRKADVQKVTNTKINPIQIRDNSKPGTRVSGNQLTTYRPKVQKMGGEENKPAPAKITSREDFKSSKLTGEADNQQSNPLLKPKTQTKPSGNPLLTPKTSPKRPTQSTTGNKTAKPSGGNPLLKNKPVQATKPKPVTPVPRQNNARQPNTSKPPVGNPLLKDKPIQKTGPVQRQNPRPANNLRPTPQQTPARNENSLIRPKPQEAPQKSNSPLLRESINSNSERSSTARQAAPSYNEQRNKNPQMKNRMQNNQTSNVITPPRPESRPNVQTQRQMQTPPPVNNRIESQQRVQSQSPPINRNQTKPPLNRK